MTQRQTSERIATWAARVIVAGCGVALMWQANAVWAFDTDDALRIARFPQRRRLRGCEPH
jgi:hypothetical protein